MHKRGHGSAAGDQTRGACQGHRARAGWASKRGRCGQGTLCTRAVHAHYDSLTQWPPCDALPYSSQRPPPPTCRQLHRGLPGVPLSAPHLQRRIQRPLACRPPGKADAGHAGRSNRAGRRAGQAGGQADGPGTISAETPAMPCSEAVHPGRAAGRHARCWPTQPPANVLPKPCTCRTQPACTIARSRQAAGQQQEGPRGPCGASPRLLWPPTTLRRCPSAAWSCRVSRTGTRRRDPTACSYAANATAASGLVTGESSARRLPLSAASGGCAGAGAAAGPVVLPQREPLVPGGGAAALVGVGPLAGPPPSCCCWRCSC